MKFRLSGIAPSDPDAHLAIEQTLDAYLTFAQVKETLEAKGIRLFQQGDDFIFITKSLNAITEARLIHD